MSLHDIAGQMLAQAATDESTANPRQIILGVAGIFGAGGYVTALWRDSVRLKRADPRLWFILGLVVAAGLALTLRGVK